MILRQFLASTQNAPAADRSAAAAALARSYLYGDLDADGAWEAKTALLALLDDPAPRVRRALSETCAASARAPRPLVVALSCDVPEVAIPMLARSPVLTDADLVDAAALGDAAVQTAIARRHHLPPAVSGALAEIADLDTLVALAANPTARITAGRLLRMVERFGEEASLREALLARPDLPTEVRHAVALRLTQALSDFVLSRGWLSPARCERMGHEAGERAALDLCADAGAAGIARLVRHLRATHRLNAGLILRAILSGRSDFAQAALADLCGLDHAAVARAMRDPRAAADLHRRAGLPAALLPAVEAALGAWRQTAARGPAGAGLSLRTIERAIAACAEADAPEMRAVAALLTSYEAEAARDAAREAARTIAAETAAREAARREVLETDAAWREAQEAVQRTILEMAEAAGHLPQDAVAPESGVAAEIEAAAAVTVDEDAVVLAEPENATLPAEAGTTAAARDPEGDADRPDQAPAGPDVSGPFNPVGAILDALPGQLLERFRDARDGGEAERDRTAQAVLDGLEAGLLAEFQAARHRAQDGPDALPIAA